MPHDGTWIGFGHRRPRRAGGRGVDALKVGLTIVAASTFGAILGFVALDSSTAATAVETRFETAASHRITGVSAARADRAIIVSGDRTPAIWRGAPAVRAQRADKPLWFDSVRVASAPARLSADLALSHPYTRVEVGPAPLWSPFLAGEGEEETPAESVAEIDVTLIETASIVALEPIETGPPPRIGLDGELIVEAPIFAPAPSFAPARRTPAPAGLAGLTPTAIETGPVAAERVRPAPPIETASVARADGRPVVSIVLTAFGLNPSASQQALQTLPKAVGVAIAPVGDAPEHWSARARRDGRVTLVETPMEPSGYPKIDPGPLTLLTSSSARDNLRRFERILQKTPKVDGVSTYLGDRFARDADALRPMLEAMAQRNLAVLQNGTGPSSLIPSLGADYGLSVQTRAIALDRDGRTRDIRRGLAALEDIARKRGYAVGVGVTMPSTVEGLAEWIEEIESRGLVLAPLRL